MKRLITIATVVLVGLASVQAAQADDQQKKKKKQTQTTETASPAPKTGGTQTSNQHVSSQTSNRHLSSQTSGNQRVTTRSSKKERSNVRRDSEQNAQVAATNKFNKSKKQKYVTNNNANFNKKAFKHFKRTGNEVSFNVARQRYVRVRHDRNWWRSHYNRIVFYGGGYWYWNNGWWYPAWGYNPYYSNYVYDGPIFGYGYAAPGDVTMEVQRALAYQRYYYGPIDGVLGAGTRSAIQRYQIDHGLAVTAAIDEPTLATLGLT